MVGYVTVGTYDLERATAFYEALLSELGAKQLMQSERLVMWGQEGGAGMLAVCIPWDGTAATSGNGTMVALSLPSRETVDALHARALELGGRDEGEPGPRGDTGMYAGYFRDLDGNKLVGFCIG